MCAATSGSACLSSRIRLPLTTLLILSATAGLPVHAQRAEPARLGADEAVSLALVANPLIERARQLEIAAGAVPARLRSLPDPTLRFGAYSVPTDSINPLDGQLRLQIQQSIPYPGTLDRRGRLAELEAERVAMGIPLARVSVAAATRRAYYELWFAEQAGRIHHAHLELVRELSTAAEERYAAGAVPQENVLRALQELTLLFTEIAAVERNVATARAALNSLLHRPPDAPLGSPQGPRIDEVDEPALDALLAATERLNPELGAARARVARDQARIDVERYEAKPDFGVTAEWWTASDGIGGRFERYAVLGTVTLPWLHGTKYSAAVDEATASRAAAEAERQAVRDRLFEAVASAWERARAAQRIAELYRTTLLPQSAQSLQAARAAYETSRADFATVVDNERTLLLNRLGLARIEADYGRAIADLYEAVGVVRRDEIFLGGPSIAPGVVPGGLRGPGAGGGS